MFCEVRAQILDRATNTLFSQVASTYQMTVYNDTKFMIPLQIM